MPKILKHEEVNDLMYNTILQNYWSVNPRCEHYNDMIALRFVQSGRKPVMEYQAEQL